MVELNEGLFIVKTKGIVGGVARIKGSRVRVSDIAVDYDYHGLSPEEIAEQYPTISASDVHAALSYYRENPGKIREEIKERENAFKER
ncbi:hypothetical protein AKJ41_05305 [candidate division MSBL1 archaeon SCGC-AAA259O05]|uniref:DUF433 domain-containing protein n=1 Tax=candidate division MSBL1 archaeon SCGC-AAA259O05 TaxID=1698271 RepID=A0A133UZA1_9EURY|nr:hypothetical protein AKJ41_05305 [candidate division MSBL1 archaeon SCGC-AAA259O05]